MSKPLRVIQGTTGNIGRRSLHAILGRDDLELATAAGWASATSSAST